MAAVVAALDHAAESWLGAAPRLALDVGVGLLVYGAACRWLKVRQARDAVDLLQQLSPRWARKLAPALVRAVAPHAGTGG